MSDTYIPLTLYPRWNSRHLKYISKTEYPKKKLSIHTYHLPVIPEGVAETFQIFLRDALYQKDSPQHSHCRRDRGFFFSDPDTTRDTKNILKKLSKVCWVHRRSPCRVRTARAARGGAARSGGRPASGCRAGAASCRCRPSCAFCRCSYRRWRRSALTSEYIDLTTF
jgi:hypothetical protein